VALVEGLQRELSAAFPWVEKVVVVRQDGAVTVKNS
jgi:hypothetical protein